MKIVMPSLLALSVATMFMAAGEVKSQTVGEIEPTLEHEDWTVCTLRSGEMVSFEAHHCHVVPGEFDVPAGTNTGRMGMASFQIAESSDSRNVITIVDRSWPKPTGWFPETQCGARWCSGPHTKYQGEWWRRNHARNPGQDEDRPDRPERSEPTRAEPQPTEPPEPVDRGEAYDNC